LPHLNVVLEEEDPDWFVSAIGDIAKARGMAEIAEKAGNTPAVTTWENDGKSGMVAHGVPAVLGSWKVARRVLAT